MGHVKLLVNNILTDVSLDNLTEQTQVHSVKMGLTSLNV